MTFEIAIPSYKRVDNCEAPFYFTKGKIYVHEFEADAYSERFGKDRVKVIPDDLKGRGMATIRNFILDNADSDRVVMVDDDVKFIGCYENEKMIMLTEDEAILLAENMFEMCKDGDINLWGLNVQTDKKFYREYSPFSLTSVVLGPFLGVIREPDIRFDPALGLKEDYDFFIQSIRKHRRVLRNNKYHYYADHITKSGGVAAYRSMAAELDHAQKFQKKWGSKIVKIQRKTQNGNESINPVVHIPIGGI